ncbi:PREDICTED: E3 ubiquitin-protein ligase RNF133 [Chrysochloris asiatica]|uniref:E3 ubiquitin-protein ligase RNF133 n=1 Tax=Chrysochloris asiatica TaxID=185453 RepID=A0A9B0WL00_CHRAS|nr:PREDICTED: E3 ubiquitin-protein ligase RNF133 [Chrysochloris asiatica]
MSVLQIDGRRNNATVSWLVKFSFLWLLSQNCCTASAVWIAYMNISFHVGNRILSELGETGVFGRSSALKSVAGVIVPPEGKSQNACNPSTNFRQPTGTETWLALIERGGCTFTQKIKVAVEKGARGVIIYNFPGTGNQVFPMFHQAFEGIVVVMIGNLKGTEMFHLIQKGVHVTAVVDVGRKHIIWMNHYFVSFVIIATATLAYFIFYHIQRLWVARIQNRRWQRLTTDLKKAFGQLQLRVLKEGDEEITPNGESCVVCFELYKPNDTVRVLTCKHFFHKNCIDPWILAHGTCPICKCDVLKALGIQGDIEDGAESLHILMSTVLSPNHQGTSNELLPARSSDKVTHVDEQPGSQNDNQPNSVAEEVRPSS